MEAAAASFLLSLSLSLSDARYFVYFHMQSQRERGQHPIQMRSSPCTFVISGWYTRASREERGNQSKFPSDCEYSKGKAFRKPRVNHLSLPLHSCNIQVLKRDLFFFYPGWTWEREKRSFVQKKYVRSRWCAKNISALHFLRFFSLVFRGEDEKMATKRISYQRGFFLFAEDRCRR